MVFVLNFPILELKNQKREKRRWFSKLAIPLDLPPFSAYKTSLMAHASYGCGVVQCSGLKPCHLNQST